MKHEYSIIKIGNKKVDNFILKCFKELWNNDVSIKLINKEYLKIDGINCSGYFDESTPILACAIKKPIDRWFSVFIHEFCHFKQFIENCPEVQNTQIKFPDGKTKDSNTIVDEIVNGKEKEYSNKIIKQAVRSCQNLEIDCEKRAYQCIIDNNFADIIDPKRYIRRANAYILFYNSILKYRKWYSGPPYEVEEILSQMPDYFLDDYTKMSKKLDDLFKKHHISKK